jgi:hypothetical protein
VFVSILAHRFSTEYPGGDHFVGIWSGMRAFLTAGTSPYGVEIDSKLSEVTVGWQKQPLIGRYSFSYPFYSLVLFMPSALLEDYSIARAIWIMASILALIGLVLTGARLVAWRAKTPILCVLVLFSMLNVYSIVAVISGNFAVFSALLIALALLSIKNGLDELAGLSLAFSTIIPQLVLPLMAFVTLWAISRRRDRLILWVYGSVSLLVAGSWLIRRDWIIGYIQALGRYYALEGVFTPGQALQNWWPGFGAQMGWILTVTLALLLIVEWRLAYGKGTRWFLWTASLTLASGPLLGLRTDPSSLVVVLLPLILMVGLWDERWGGRYGWTSAAMLALLFLGLWAPVWPEIDALAYPGDYPILFFSLPIFALLGLYWVRWMAIRPRGTVMDELRRREDL